MRDIDQTLGFLLGKITQRLGDLFQDSLSSVNITAKQYGLLLLVSKNNNSLTQKQVGDILMVDRTTIGQQVDILESQKLMSRVKSPSDKRAYNLVVTDQAQLLVRSLEQKMKEAEDILLSVLTPEQREQFIQLAQTIYKEEVKKC